MRSNGDNVEKPKSILTGKRLILDTFAFYIVSISIGQDYTFILLVIKPSLSVLCRAGRGSQCSVTRPHPEFVETAIDQSEASMTRP